MRTYETTILVRTSAARNDLDGTLAAVRALYEKEGAEFIELEQWEERRLAYPIKDETSAVYLIGYFTAEGDAVNRIEQRVKRDDAILRQLTILRDGRDYEAIRAQRAKAAAESANASED